MIDVTSLEYRKQILKDIKSDENKARKRESLKRYEVLSKRHEPYVLEKLRQEFDEDTVSNMRKIMSINLSETVVNEKASLYQSEPERNYSSASGELKENVLAQIKELNNLAKIDVKMKSANKKHKFQNQGTIQVIPTGGVVGLRILQPHHFDVIPSEIDPETAEVYIISSLDRSTNMPSASGASYQLPISSDGNNQSIADQDDYKKSLERYTWWTKDHNFITDGNGDIVLTETYDNPIKELPFVDFSIEKDYEYWCRYGSEIVEFTLDFALLLSDTANINRMQGYSQAVITSEELPKSVRVGPNEIIHLKLDPQRTEAKPSFEFATPNPDMQSSLQFLDIVVNLFLTSIGADPKVISAKGDGKKYASGIDRLLAMLERFEASKDDMDLFRGVEERVFKLMVKWSNLFQGTTDNPLVPKLQQAVIPEDTEMTIKYVEPQMIQSKSETEDSVIKRMKSKLISWKRALMEIYDIDEDKAEEMKKEINEDSPGAEETDPEDPETKLLPVKKDDEDEDPKDAA